MNKVEQEVAKTYSDVPELIRQKELELSSENHRLANFVEFIAEGRGNQTIGKALQETENKAKVLEMEIDGFRRSCNKVFQSPPIEWVQERLSQIQQLLEQNTGQSALALRKLLGPIKFEPTYPDIGKPYYVAQISLNALAIVAPLTDLGNTDNGADSYLWWTWSQRIRTISILNFEFILLDTATPPLYQEISAKSVQLHQLGLSKKSIATKLKVDEKTVSKAIRWTKQD